MSSKIEKQLELETLVGKTTLENKTLKNKIVKTGLLTFIITTITELGLTFLIEHLKGLI